MKRNVFVSLLFALLVFAYPAHASNIMEFSAIYTEKDGDTIKKNKIYVARDMSRVELDEGNEIIVTRYDKKVIWIIFPKMKCYVEEECPTQASDVMQTGNREGVFGDLTRKFVGYENLDSYRTKKYLNTMKIDSKKETVYEYYEWYRDNFPFPVKTASVLGESISEYAQIKQGPQDINMFMFPKKYKKVTMDEIKAMEKEDSANTKNTKKKP